MTKRELVIEVAEKFGFTQNEVSSIVQATLDTITHCLTEGQRLEIRNFGVFEVKSRDARMGRNPRTGEEVPIAEKRVASFKPGKALKELVQSGAVGSVVGEPVVEAAPPQPEPAPPVSEASPVSPPHSADGEQGQLF